MQDEQLRLLEHLSRCTSCREIVSVTATQPGIAGCCFARSCEGRLAFLAGFALGGSGGLRRGSGHGGHAATAARVPTD